MATTEPPHKRPRMEADLEICPSSELWMNDGNIVVIAGGTAFKVHRGVLARQSPVFRDMFAIPLPPSDGKNTVDGSPVVHVSETPEDFRYLLKAFYDGPSLLQYGTVMPFSTAAPLFELAQKYNIEPLRTDIIHRMKTCFVHSFAQWRSSVERITAEEQQPTLLHMLRSSALELVVDRDAIRAVNIVRSSEESLMLPLSLYLCALLPVQTLLAGITRPDGTVDRLSSEDLERCLEARSTLSLRRFIRFSRGINGYSYGCQTTNACQKYIDHQKSARLASRDASALLCMLQDPGPLGEPTTINNRLVKPCQPCRAAMYKQDEKEIENLWGTLPLDLGLEIEGWNIDESEAEN